jgi:hypothetical protein
VIGGLKLVVCRAVDQALFPLLLNSHISFYTWILHLITKYLQYQRASITVLLELIMHPDLLENTPSLSKEGFVAQITT